MTQDPATIGLEALTFIASDDAEISRFLQLSGLTVDELRRTADQRPTLASVLDYVLGHEATARTFAENHGYRPEDLIRALHELGGGRPS